MLSAFAACNARLEKGCAYGAGLCLALFTVAVLVDVVFRQLFLYPLLWPSEIAVALFIWSVMLGSAVCTRRNIHLACEVLPKLPPAPQRILRLAVDALGLVFAAVVLWTGIELALGGIRRFSPMMGYPLWPYFAAIPVAALATVLFSLERLLTGALPARTAAPEGAAAIDHAKTAT